MHMAHMHIHRKADREEQDIKSADCLSLPRLVNADMCVTSLGNIILYSVPAGAAAIPIASLQRMLRPQCSKHVCASPNPQELPEGGLHSSDFGVMVRHWYKYLGIPGNLGSYMMFPTCPTIDISKTSFSPGLSFHVITWFASSLTKPEACSSL